MIALPSRRKRPVGVTVAEIHVSVAPEKERDTKRKKERKKQRIIPDLISDKTHTGVCRIMTLSRILSEDTLQCQSVQKTLEDDGCFKRTEIALQLLQNVALLATQKCCFLMSL